jgi:hypothetical protein
MLLICFSSQLWAESAKEKTQVSAAQVWLSLIDGGNYSDSWNEASTYFRGVVNKQSWEASMETSRKPLGKLVSRKIVETQESDSLPGVPDGRYAVMFFKAVFEQKKSVTETVTFIFDNDGK